MRGLAWYRGSTIYDRPMPARSSTTPLTAGPLRPAGRVTKVVRYASGSVVAAGCSELALVVLYGFLDVSAMLASGLAWMAGAVPNYWLNRSWTWGLRGGPSLRREVVPYIAIIIATLLLAMAATHAVDSYLRADGTTSEARVFVVAVVFLAVYVVMFVLRFFLFDRLFTRLADSGVAETGWRPPR